MGKTYIYELKKLESLLLDATNDAHKDFANPVLTAEFTKAINNITLEKWNSIKDVYLENVKSLVTLDEKMAYTVLAFKMGNCFLNKNIYYVEEFLTTILTMEISPLNYVHYANLILNPPFYDIIVNLVQNSQIFYYFEFMHIVINIVGSNPTSYEINYALKALHQIKGDTYTLLIDSNDDINKIYTKLYTQMIEANNKILTYNKADFMKLNTLLTIGKDEEKEIIKEIIEIENTSYSIKEIINKTLDLLYTHTKIIPITRRKNHGTHK